ncbi:hypothetical protein PoB_007156200 [Plakobranchus ocellatus]|uniref:Uncharacterized protein n=1 Tax=Plakobranchus ocellatus TaxID=259542 RepID=A0AAV4DLA0_9GAST|nr:hypothetical protein PoB_007156200 [Plakobranchus ocellatus]
MIGARLTVFAIGLFFIPATVTAQTYNQSAELLTNLFNGYDRDIRPLQNQSGTVNVNEKDQTISVRTALLLSWMDELLTWTPQDYGNLEVINPGVDRTWLPPLNLAGQINDIQALVDTSIVTPIRVRYSGSVAWFTNVRLVQTCKMDMTYFPNDEHICLFEIYTLMYTTDQVNLILASSGPGLSSFVENGEWELKAASWATSTYNVNTDVYQVINMSLTIKRRPRFFLLNLLFPTLALSFLNILVFVLPADSGEKVGYSITVLLSVMLIMGVTTDSMPASSQLPLITQFLASLVAVSVLSVVATVIALFVHHKVEEESKEQVKTMSILSVWKEKIARKFFKPSTPQQVYPIEPQRETNHSNDKTCRPSTRGSCKTAGIVLSNGPTAQDSDTSTEVAIDKETMAKTESGNGQKCQNNFLPAQEVRPKSGVGGLWFRGKTGLNDEKNTLSNKSDKAKDSDNACTVNNKGKTSTFLTLMLVNLDLIFFWVFLITWLMVTMGFSIAIFT